MYEQMSASDIVRAAVSAMESERWADLLHLVRPEAIQRFRGSQLGFLLRAESHAPRTAEEVQSEQPWLSREAAAAYASQEDRNITRGLPQLRAEWGVESSLSELEALSSAEFFTRYLAASSPSAQIRVSLAASHAPVEDPARAVAAAPQSRIQRVVLGEIREGRDKAHVLIRVLNGGVGYDPETDDGYLQVTTLDWGEGRWWLRIDHTLLYRQGWTYAWAVDDRADPDQPAAGGSVADPPAHRIAEPDTGADRSVL